MGRGQFGPVVHQFRQLFDGRSVAGISEWHLLHRYLDRGDEVAFEAIVSRHGPMVLGVCRRLLVDPRDVEDAFQATFLILARKGGTLGEADPVGHWLYGVASRVALRARSSAARRRARERSAAASEVAKSEGPARFELGEVIDEELARLPSKYRAPVVLCYLEGLSHDEAGRQLGWPLGTVKGRLSRARDLLRERLTRRGLAPAGFAGVVALVRESRASVPAGLRELTMRAAMAGRSAGAVPAAVASLAAGSLTSMWWNKWKAAGAALLVFGTGAAVMAYQGSKAGGSGPRAEVAQRQAVPPAPEASDVPDWEAGWPSLTAPVDDNPKTKAIQAALDEPIAMNFPNETPLSDVLAYITAATKGDSLPKGIPIYVDPQGLQIADKTMASTVSIELEGVSLRVTLSLILKQLGLAYEVRHGMMTINARNSEDQPTPFAILEEKAKKGELSRREYKQLIEMLKLRNQVEELVRQQHLQ